VNLREQMGERDPRTIYSQFLQPGDLVFDIGANIGLRAQLFLDMGLRVVSVEPQPECAARINPEATVICAAAGAKSGTETFYPASPNWLSTLSQEYIEATKYEWPVQYLEPVEVRIVTMDELIAEHGVPAFLKIDVEGGELGVLQGLSTPVKALSFEMHNVETEKMFACVEELKRLGDYEISYSAWESFMMSEFPPPPEYTWGDVYAVLK
jgi:FkbM family methyltransferase